MVINKVTVNGVTVSKTKTIKLLQSKFSSLNFVLDKKDLSIKSNDTNVKLIDKDSDKAKELGRDFLYTQAPTITQIKEVSKFLKENNIMLHTVPELTEVKQADFTLKEKEGNKNERV